MHYLRLYSDPTGESHFEDVVVELHPVEYVPGKPPVDLSAPHPATGAVFCRVPAGWCGDAHPSPRRQLIITLAGELDVAASDGEVRRMGHGIAWLLEDITGKGHRTQTVGGHDWLGVVVPLA